MNSGYGDPVSWLFILIGFPIVWLFSKKRLDQHGEEKLRYDQIHAVRIQIHGKDVTVSGFIDSGNQLVCPMTKLPVAIGDAPFMSNWLKDEEMLEFKAACDAIDPTRIPEAWTDITRMVPYQGVDGKAAFMCALKPDFIEIMYEGNLIRTDKVLIGMQFGNMTVDQSYQCLLHPHLIKQALMYTA